MAERSVAVQPLHGIRLPENLNINDLTMKIKSHMAPWYELSHCSDKRFIICIICHLHTYLTSSQGVWLRSQEAGKLGRERLPPVCRAGPRTTCFCHRQLYQQGHAVTAPIEGDKERESEPRSSGVQLAYRTTGSCCFWLWTMTIMPSLPIQLWLLLTF